MGKEEEKKMWVRVAGNCAPICAAAELKRFITLVLFICSVATVIHFLPSPFSLQLSDLRLCLYKLPTAVEVFVQPPTPSMPKQDVVTDGWVVKRAFNPYGAAAYNFVLMNAYRGGLDTFAVLGLASKPLHVFATPSYQCQWFPGGATQQPPITTAGYKILPDWGYGRVYTVIVVNCTFPSPVGQDGSGGKLVVLASTNGGGDMNFNRTDRIEALIEGPGSLDPSHYTSRPRYDYLYCGSPLFGNLSPQRVREWLAYHVRLFGARSHFVLYDAGGVQPAVMEVLKPWMEKGYVSLHDIREQERFDGYYHNQFLIVNDCLHRYRFDAMWMFFFDVDEFVYVAKKRTIKSVTESVMKYTQFSVQQMAMSNKLCLSDDKGETSRKWGFEKLVYRDIKKGVRRDRKYAVQPRNVFATGVHLSQNLAGKSAHQTEGQIKYFHYHGTLADRQDPCRQFLNASAATVDGNPYVIDTTMRGIAVTVKRFEFNTIGPRLQGTQQ